MSIDSPYDLLVVGAGPVGLSAALLAAKAGLRCALVEQRAGPTGHPAGHVLNARTMEIWREIDPALEAEIRNDSAPLEDLRHIVWCTSLTGPELCRIDILPGTAEETVERLSQSPSRPLHYPQHRLEALLWKWARASTGIDFLSDHKLQALEQDTTGVQAQLRAGNGSERRLSARYCLAADGARSRIREQLGIAMPGPMIARIASVNFRAKLDRLIRGRPAVIYWIYNQHLVGPLVRHMGDDWILMAMLHPPQQIEQFDQAYWRQLIGQALGTQAVDVEIKAIGNWAMTAQIAERFRAGSVFLAGDAAHRFPPTGGYGINTGVGDVHNLVWKLQAVLAGQAGESLLDSYESERKPVAEKNCRRSIDNQDEMDHINEAVALPMDDLRKLHAFMEGKTFLALPKRMQSWITEVLPRLGLKKIAVLEQPESWRAKRLRARLSQAASEQKAHFGGAHAVDLGYRYHGALSLPVPVDASELSPNDLEYRPGTAPGLRLPHAWLEKDGQRLSTVDCLDYGALQLLVDSSWRADWAEALSAALAASQFAYPVRLLALGADETADAQADGQWQGLRGVGASGAILVRPDGHVAWRSRALPADPAGEFAAVLRQLGAAFGPAIRSPVSPA